MTDDNLENNESDESKKSVDDEQDYDQWESALEQEKQEEINENLAREEINMRQGELKSAAGLAAKGFLKNQIKKKITKQAVGKFLIWAAPYILIAFLVLLIIFILYYFISNPCELARIVGEWWATMVGAGCKLVGK